jgi:hypothetical protein
MDNGFPGVTVRELLQSGEGKEFRTLSVFQAQKVEASLREDLDELSSYVALADTFDGSGTAYDL